MFECNRNLALDLYLLGSMTWLSWSFGESPLCLHWDSWLQVHSFLRKTHFTNPLGDKVIMKQRVITQEDYDIFHFGNLSQHLGIKLKLGKFSPYFSHGRHFHLYVDMIEVATGSRKMPSSVCSAECSPGFRRLWKEGMAACCFVCSPCPENEISNETSEFLLLW